MGVEACAPVIEQIAKNGATTAVTLDGNYTLVMVDNTTSYPDPFANRRRSYEGAGVVVRSGAGVSMVLVALVFVALL
jgi:hypothetical protein